MLTDVPWRPWHQPMFRFAAPPEGDHPLTPLHPAVETYRVMLRAEGAAERLCAAVQAASRIHNGLMTMDEARAMMMGYPSE